MHSLLKFMYTRSFLLDIINTNLQKGIQVHVQPNH